MSIADRLKKLRINKNLNLKELAEILNLSDSGISKYENDKANPTANVIINYCNYFNVSSDYILFGKEIIDPSEIIELYNMLNDEYKIIAKHELKKLIKEQQHEENSKGKSSDYGTNLKSS